MSQIDYQHVLDEITKEVQPLLSQGKVADYIPALAEVEPNQFAIAIHTVDGKPIARVIVVRVLQFNLFRK